MCLFAFLFGGDIETMRDDSELMVITKSRELAKCIFEICEKSPKRFRLTLVAKMSNQSLDILESLILANEVMIGRTRDENEKRINYQHSAIAKLKVLDSVVLIAREQQCILPKQYERITRLISECIKLTGGWINSDRKRF